MNNEGRCSQAGLSPAENMAANIIASPVTSPRNVAMSIEVLTLQEDLVRESKVKCLLNSAKQRLRGLFRFVDMSQDLCDRSEEVERDFLTDID